MNHYSEKLAKKERSARSAMSPLLRAALLFGVVIHLIGFFFVRMDSSPLPILAEDQPFVTFVSTDSFTGGSELEAHAVLQDSAPLFIPTVWNAAQSFPPVLRPVVGGKFPEFEPDINLIAELRPADLEIDPAFNIEKPMEMLASRFWRLFKDFGQSGEVPQRFPDTSPIAEIVVVAGAGSAEAFELLTLPVEVEGRSAVSASAPVVYFLRVSGGFGVLGAPTLGQSSGHDSFDRAVLAWLQRPEVRAQLPAGYLEITVIP